MKFTPLRMSGFRAFEFSAGRGETLAQDTPLHLTKANARSFSVYVEGSARVTHRGSGKVTHREAGMTSADLAWDFAPGESFDFEVMSDTFRYYCLADTDGKALDGVPYRLADGESVEIAFGRRVFVAMGTVRVAQRELAAPSLANISSASVVFESVGGALIVSLA